METYMRGISVSFPCSLPCFAGSNPAVLLGVMCVQADLNQLDSLPLFTISLEPTPSPSLTALASLLQQRNILSHHQQLKLVLTRNLHGLLQVLIAAGISLPPPSAITMLIDPMVLYQFQVHSLCAQAATWAI